MDSSMSVTQVAAAMMTKMTDAVLFQDAAEPGRVTGILTDTDIIKRLVGAEDFRDPRTLTAAEVMTRNPSTCAPSTHGLDALSTMVQGRYRHLPVEGADGKVSGVLDLSRCLYDALANLETMYTRAECLVQGLMDDQSSACDDAEESKARQEAYFRRVKDGVLGPCVGELCAVRELVSLPATATVREAAREMRRTDQSAVLVLDAKQSVQGIVTSKDIVKRVVSKGGECDAALLDQVMTPYPDTVEPGLSVIDALHRMHRNVYSHLPVVDAHQKPLGVVDTVQVTRHLYESIHTVRRTCNLHGLADLWRQAYPENDEVGAEDDVDDLLSVLSSATGLAAQLEEPDLSSLAVPTQVITHGDQLPELREEVTMTAAGSSPVSSYAEGWELMPPRGASVSKSKQNSVAPSQTPYRAEPSSERVREPALHASQLDATLRVSQHRGVFRIVEASGDFRIQRDCCEVGVEGLHRALKDKLRLAPDARLLLTWRDEASAVRLQDDRDLHDAILLAASTGIERQLRVEVCHGSGAREVYGSLEEPKRGLSEVLGGMVDLVQDKIAEDETMAAMVASGAVVGFMMFALWFTRRK